MIDQPPSRPQSLEARSGTGGAPPDRVGPPRPVIRPATSADLTELADVRALAWRESYAGLLPDAVIEAQVDRKPQVIGLWERALERDESIWLALVEDHLVGYAHAAAAPAQAPAPLELVGLYLLRRAQGLGLGRALVHTAVGDAPCLVWVLENNEPAIGFYRAAGFEPDGARQEVAPVFEGIQQIRMVRR